MLRGSLMLPVKTLSKMSCISSLERWKALNQKLKESEHGQLMLISFAIGLKIDVEA
jgi:hypothetical protein